MGLDSGVEYTIRIIAFNANGYSPSSTVVATPPIVTTLPSLSAGVTNINSGNYGLLIRGSNSGKGEQVLIPADWTVATDPTQAFPLAPMTTDAVFGAFSTTSPPPWPAVADVVLR